MGAEFRFIRDREYARGVERFLNPLPRSVVRSNEYELLDGEWRFEHDPDDVGLREEWYKGRDLKQSANWPGSVEEHLAAAQSDQQVTRGWKDFVVVWYEREFTIPESWFEDPNRLVQVTFGACGYETRVWLNGHLLRCVEGQEIHYGEYTSFSYELPTHLIEPVNTLTVRIADSYDADVPRGKQESHVYKRGGIWYQTYTGGVRSVWIEPVQRNRLRSRLGVSSDVKEGLVEFTITTRVHDQGAYTAHFVISERGSSEPVVVSDFPLHLEPGEKRHRLIVNIPDAVVWSPENPNLYHLVIQLVDPTEQVSQIEAHFGFRKFEARGREVYLNEEPIYLDGILYQPGTSTYEQIRRHFFAMKKLGCNLVRVHIAGIDPRIYDLADEMGMLLWVEVPSPHTSTHRSRQNHWEELMRMLVIIVSHPSVVILSLYNEDWGIQDIETNPRARRYISEAYQYLRVHHPELLVVDNDGWRHVSEEGRLVSDLLTAHFYTTDFDHWRNILDRFSRGETNEVAAFPLVIGDQYFYRGQVPLVISEWGGFGWEGYGGPEEMHSRAEKLRQFKEEIRKFPIAGDVYTQATSIEEETNGIIDPETGDLLVPENILCSRSDASTETETPEMAAAADR